MPARRRVLVTGGAGFVGSHACKALWAAGYLPVSFDSLERGHEQAVKWGPLARGDIRRIDELRAVFAEWRPSAVLHFAAYAYVGESTAAPLSYYENNVGGVVALASACVEFGCGRIIFSSSCATYGAPERLPIREETPQAPINPYGWSKLMGERALSDAARAHGLRCAALRYFNASGSDPEGEIGETHEPETHLIPLAIGAALGRKPPLPVFGDDYPTPDGTCVRDYVHVSDLVDAHVSALGWLSASDEPFAAFNLCSERGHSVAEVVATVGRVLRRPVPTEMRGRRSGDPPTLIGCSRKARETLGWRPRFADLGTQIAHAANWIVKRDSLAARSLADPALP